MMPREMPKKIFFFPVKSSTRLPPLYLSLISSALIRASGLLSIFAILSTSI